MPKDYILSRIGKIQKLVKCNKLDALLVTNPTNVSYLSGFTGNDSWLLVGRNDPPLLITDSRYMEQAHAQCPHCNPADRKGPIHHACLKLLHAAGSSVVGFESDSLTYEQWAALRQPDLDWQPTSGLVAGMRIIKDPGEVDAIRRAITIAQEAFIRVRDWVRPGMTEAQVASEIDAVMRQLGASGSAFPTIVLFGERCSMPHGQPGLRMLKAGEPVLIDWGARVGLYNCDLTRMLLPSKISTKLERVYRTVLAAQQAAMHAGRPGMAARELDAAARDYITKARMGHRFGHGLGHGVGIDIHEAPSINPKSTLSIQPGMVFTIEPGIYIPGWGGVRIEDMVIITRDGHTALTSLAKDMEEVRVL